MICRNMKLLAAMAAVGAIAVSGVAAAIVTFDPATGTGFVGKGDVQLIYGWNNHALQANAASVEFRVNSVSTTEWTCTKPQPTPNDPEKVIVQERRVTTTTQGLLNDIARDNSKGKNGPITGFNLLGYNGGSTTTTASGPAVGSCPANPSGFAYDDNASTTQSGGGVQVSINGTDWLPLS